MASPFDTSSDTVPSMNRGRFTYAERPSSVAGASRAESEISVDAIGPGTKPSGAIKANVNYVANQLMRGGNRLGKYMTKKVARTRRRLPLVNFILTRMVPQASAIIFLADVITDALVTGIYLASERVIAKVFAAFSILFIIGPLCLTAVFITRSQARAYINRRKNEEVRKALMSSDLMRAMDPQEQLHTVTTADGVSGFLGKPTAGSKFDPSNTRPADSDGNLVIDGRGPVLDIYRRNSILERSDSFGEHDRSPRRRNRNHNDASRDPSRSRPVRRGHASSRAIGEATEPLGVSAPFATPRITNTTTTSRVPDAQVTVTMPGSEEASKAKVPEAIMKKILREARICSIFAFPIMLLAAAGFDLALILVALYPRVTYFMGVESVMPQYYAYRTLVEVVLEAIPQVCLQVISLFVNVTGRTQTDTEDTKRFVGFNAAIVFSIIVALVNLVKTLIMLKAEASSLSMNLVPYIKYLMEVGSAQLPLRSITDNSIGERFDYTLNLRSEIRPLYEAIKKNISIKNFSFSNMLDTDIVQILEVLEGRQVGYSIDITGTTFRDDTYILVLLAVLRGRYAEQLSFRSCRTDVTSWVHREAFTLLNFKLPKNCIDDGVPFTSGEASEMQRREFGRRLLNDWLMPAEVCSVSNTNLSHPISIGFHVPQPPGSLLAAFHFLKQHVTIHALDCDYALSPITLKMMLNLVLQRPRELHTLSLRNVHAATTGNAVDTLEKVLSQATALENVTLSRVWGDSAGQSARILMALSKCSSLRFLKLTGSSLCETSCSLLGSGLAKWARLRQLHVDHCCIDDTCARALASSLGDWRLPSLSQVHMGGNLMTAIGVEAFCGALQKCRKLLLLDISCDGLQRDYDQCVAPQGTRRYASPFSTHNAAAVAFQQGMAVIDRPLVAAMSSLLATVPNVLCRGCIWTPEALQDVVATHLVRNPALRLLALNCDVPASSISGRSTSITVADLLNHLRQRSVTEEPGFTDLLTLRVSGMPAGKLAPVLEDSEALLSHLTHLSIDCTAPATASATASANAGTPQAPYTPAFDVMEVNNNSHSPIWVALAQAASLTHLELLAASPYSPPASSFHRALVTFRNLNTLVLDSALIGGTNLFQSIGATSGHALSAVERLCLRKCGLGFQDADQLGRLLVHMPRLSELTLSGNAITGTGVEKLLQHWAGRVHAPAPISVLDLSSNPLGSDGARTIADCMPNFLSLRVLRLSSVRLRSLGLKIIAESIVRACEGEARKQRTNETGSETGYASSNLAELDLEDNDIGPTGTEALSLALYDMQVLERLLFVGNRPEYEGCMALMQACTILPNLQVLTLGGDLSAHSFVNRSRALPADANSTVAPGSLQAGLNAAAAAVAVLPSSGPAGGLTWEGARLVFAALRHMHTLRELRILCLGVPSGGEADSAITVLSQSLAGMPGLQVLDLRGVGLHGQMASKLTEAASGITGLTQLDLRLAFTSPQAAEVLRDAAENLHTQVLLD